MGVTSFPNVRVCRVTIHTPFTHHLHVWLPLGCGCGGRKVPLRPCRGPWGDGTWCPGGEEPGQSTALRATVGAGWGAATARGTTRVLSNFLSKNTIALAAVHRKEWENQGGRANEGERVPGQGTTGPRRRDLGILHNLGDHKSQFRHSVGMHEGGTFTWGRCSWSRRRLQHMGAGELLLPKAWHLTMTGKQSGVTVSDITCGGLQGSSSDSQVRLPTAGVDELTINYPRKFHVIADKHKERSPPWGNWGTDATQEAKVSHFKCRPQSTPRHPWGRPRSYLCLCSVCPCWAHRIQSTNVKQPAMQYPPASTETKKIHIRKVTVL